jgi:hypothetical protein
MFGGNGCLSSGEKSLYPGVRKALTDYFRQSDDQIAIMLDITANEFPQSSQVLLQSNVLYLLDSREFRPDWFGVSSRLVWTYRPRLQAYGRRDFVLTAEVKLGAPALRDLFQAKMYGELYWAPVSLLVCTEQPEERLRRLLSERLDLFGYSGGNYQLYLCRYLESTGTIDWWLDGRSPRWKK